MKNWFLHSEIPNSDPDKAFFHIFPIPLERTVSFGAGTEKGPEKILEVSGQLEYFDLRYGSPADSGIHTHSAIYPEPGVRKTLQTASNTISATLENGAFPIVLGGEHTVTYAPITALKKAGRKFGVINFDAHADFRQEYEGDRFSHACVMRRIWEHSIPVVQIGNRAICKEEFEFIQNENIPFYPAKEICAQKITSIELPPEFPEEIYISIDADGFDPSVMPATGTPVPGGFDYDHFFSLVESLLQSRKLIGFDFVEFAPIPGFHSADYFCADIIYKMMGIAQKQNSKE